MTHLSDYSFTQRAIANGWFYVWFVAYVFRYDRFGALNPRRILRFELRSIVTLLLLIAIPLHLSYDIGCAVIKYQEGFWSNPNSGQIISRPSFLWAPSNQDQASVLDYALACAIALLTSIFFLLQAFYHYISKSVTKSSFMSSFEFRLNIICSLIVLVVFPTIQFVFRNNHAYREAAPQMAFSIVLLAIAFLGFRTHFRFKSLLKNALLTINENTQGVAEKLEYFKDMNTILTGAMLGSGIALGVSSADGLTPNPVIAHNKFASDFLVTNVNFFEFIIWVTLVLIFYPRRSIVGTAFGVSSGGAGSVTRTVPTSTRPQKSQVDNSDTKYSNGNGTNNARSSLVPYRAPDESNISKSDYIDIERSGSTRHNHGGYNDNDTYPLTKAVGQDDSGDAMQLNTFKIMHDERSLSRNSVAGSLSSVSPRYQQQVISSVPQSPRSPVSPTLSSPRRNGATSPTPFDLPYHQRIAGRGTMTSPGSPSFGSAVPRQPASAVTAPEITHVGQHAFILEEAPRSSRQRTKLATQTQWQEGQRQQQQTTITDYNQARPLSPSTPTTPTIPTTPMRVRKEFRSPPTS